MAAGNRAHEAEAEPVARRAAARLQPDKPVEHARAVTFRYARSAVGNLDHGAAIARAYPDRDVASAILASVMPGGAMIDRAIFEGVVDEVGKRLRQQVPVAADHRRRSAVEA